MSTDRTSGEKNSGPWPAAGNQDAVHMQSSGQTMPKSNQSHDEGSSYGSVDWCRPDSHPPVESVSSDADDLSPSSAHDPSSQDSNSPLVSSEEERTLGDQGKAHMAPGASSRCGTLQFARPEAGFNPADDQFVRQYHKEAGSTHHVLGHLRQPGQTMKERYLQSINDLRRATGRAPTEQERAFIEKTLRKNTGWLEGYKATVEGQATVPMAAFNRLAQDYEDTILQIARDRVAYEADTMVSILRRDDKIEALQQKLDAIRPQEAGKREKDLKAQLNALSEEIERLKSQSSKCISLEAEMAQLKEQDEQKRRARILATESYVRRTYERRIAALEEQLRECETRRERHSLKMTALDVLSDEVTQLRQENAELRDSLAEYEASDEEGTSNDPEYESSEGDDGEDGTAPSEADIHSENEAVPHVREPSPGFFLLKNAFADAQRLRVANKEVTILKAKLEQAKENQKDLLENNGDLAPKLNRALGRLAARDSEIALLQAQVVDAENRAARNLAAVNGQGRVRTVDEELLKQWRDATERNNLQILTELADEDAMLATWQDDVKKLFRDYQSGQLTKESGEYSFDRMVPL